MATISDRIKEGMEIRGMKQADIIERTGINKGALSCYVSGKYKPKQNGIYLIARALDVNEAWLMGADVPMDRLATTTPTILSQDEEALIDGYRQLNNSGKKQLNKQLSMMLNDEDYRKDIDESGDQTA